MRRTFLSGLTIVFVAAVTLVTVVPINVLITPAELAEAYAPSVVVTSAEPQQLAAVSGGADVPISRDQYTVTALRKKLLAVTAGRRASYFNDPSWKVQWPIGVGVPMSDQFGPRVLCASCGVTQHRGTDFLPGRGAPVQAIAEGVVRYVEESDNGLGVHAIIDHRIDGELVSSVYAHMEFGSLAVYPGQSVSVGQLIGTVGDTGFCFGPHLHFEIRLGGTQHVDPVAWLEHHVG
ncbi:M23 family metallopeptidase [Naasia sp. SYSU D00948]|uniref:M23 family metallopeptidase n=1 Tax=Naasia sp. SYSU D00948 TaxID=2817379 RepID=UPI001B30DF70|nr:M23 family metallopeptidase [Naasia sp. SYSU D00948]